MAPLPIDISTAIPYAGIIQVRFKGYILSRTGTPRISYLYAYFNFFPKSSTFVLPSAVRRRGRGEFQCRRSNVKGKQI